jgi:hypothetical protein
MDADTLVLHSASLIVQGFVHDLPQVLFAITGGLLARRVVERLRVGSPS